MVGAVPVCPPERPRSGVSIRKGYIPIRKGGISIHKRCMLTPKHVCALRRWMRPCRATRAGTQAPPLPASIKPLCHVTSLIFVRRQTVLQQSYDASHTRNGRGGACVPARTSAQRRFHP